MFEWAGGNCWWQQIGDGWTLVPFEQDSSAESVTSHPPYAVVTRAQTSTLRTQGIWFSFRWKVNQLDLAGQCSGLEKG